jgi:hypothetical protein
MLRNRFLSPNSKLLSQHGNGNGNGMDEGSRDSVFSLRSYTSKSSMVP